MGTAREEGPFWFVPNPPPGPYVSEDMFFEQAAPTERVPHGGKRIFLCPYSFRTKSRMSDMMFDETTTVPEIRCDVVSFIRFAASLCRQSKNR